jgi:hypothetical protein
MIIYDERLEFLSDQVRKGIPIDLNEAIEVINYQNYLKKNRPVKKSILNWIKNILKRKNTK